MQHLFACREPSTGSTIVSAARPCGWSLVVADKRRQCREPLRLQPQLQRHAGSAVVPVFGGIPAVRRLQPASQPACAHRPHLQPPVGARAQLVDVIGIVVFLIPVAVMIAHMSWPALVDSGSTMSSHPMPAA